MSSETNDETLGTSPIASDAPAADVADNFDPGSVLILERPSRWSKAVVQRLNELCRLSVGWDGYGAPPVSFGTANFALNMMKSVCGSSSPVPSIVPGINGDLQVEWHLETADIELHVRAPNDVHAWRKTPGTGEDGEELVLTVDFTPIVQWIRDLAESADAVISTAA